MRKLFNFTIVIAVLAGSFFYLSSCNKSAGNAPTVMLVKSTGYVSADTILSRGTVFDIWVYASKKGADDLINSGSVLRSINGGPDITLQTISLVSAQFNQTFTYNAGDSGTVSRYTYTFANQNGLSNSASVNVTAK